MSNIPSSILIIEPHRDLEYPYAYIPELYPTTDKIKRVNSTIIALDYLSESIPDLVLMSATFSYVEQLEVLEKVNRLSKKRSALIAIVIVVDLGQPLNSVLGSYWAGKMSVLCSSCNRAEAMAALERVINAN